MTGDRTETPELTSDKRNAAMDNDVEKQLEAEKADSAASSTVAVNVPPAGHRLSATAPEPNNTTILTFTPQDPSNPRNWSHSRKIFVVVAGILLVMNSTIGSSLPSGISDQVAREFNVMSETQLVLPAAMYLLGYVVGPLAFSPLSETYGRQIVMRSTFLIYTAFSLGCALAPSWAGLVIMRFLTGLGASTPLSVIGGIYADLYASPTARGRAISIFSEYLHAKRMQKSTSSDMHSVRNMLRSPLWAYSIWISRSGVMAMGLLATAHSRRSYLATSTIDARDLWPCDSRQKGKKATQAERQDGRLCSDGTGAPRHARDLRQRAHQTYSPVVVRSCCSLQLPLYSLDLWNLLQ